MFKDPRMRKFCFIFGVCCILIISMDAARMKLRAAAGHDARLPCGDRQLYFDEPDTYIMWLKNDNDSLYRFPSKDNDGRTPGSSRIFSRRCNGFKCIDSTSLLVKNVGEKDEATYTCIVHERGKSAVEHFIELQLVEPPVVRVFNEMNQEIRKNYIGPLALGSSFHLICEVSGEEMHAKVFWYRNGEKVQRAYKIRQGVLRAELHVQNATRNEVNAHYECTAQTADVTDPISVGVIVKMFLPPMRVEIRVDNNFNFEDGHPRMVDCLIIGCVPAPTVTWLLGGVLQKPRIHKELHDGNYTMSSLSLVPAFRQDKQELICRVHNPLIPNEVFEDKITLNIGYRPVCADTPHQAIGAYQLEPESMTCIVDSLPEPVEFIWTFPSSKVVHTKVQKVAGHEHRYSSTLTWLAQESDVGAVDCRAVNVHGEQKEPCQFMVSVGGPPKPPTCSVLRSYPNNVQVECRKGWDGGRPQMIHLETYDSDKMLISNMSESSGLFHLPDINVEDNMTGIVYSATSRGVSEKRTVSFRYITDVSASAVTEAGPTYVWARWLEGASVVVAIAVAAIVITYCTRIFNARRLPLEINPDLVPRAGDGTFHREPDFVRDERVLGTTNITVNQLSACKNQYSAAPLPSCRLLAGCSGQPQDSHHAYYV